MNNSREVLQYAVCCLIGTVVCIFIEPQSTMTMGLFTIVAFGFAIKNYL